MRTIRQAIAALIDLFRARTFWNDWRGTPLPLYLREVEGVTTRLPTRACKCVACGALYIPVTTEAVDLRCGSKGCDERARQRAREEKQRVAQFKSRKLAG